MKNEKKRLHFSTNRFEINYIQLLMRKLYALQAHTDFETTPNAISLVELLRVWVFFPAAYIQVKMNTM